MIHVTERKNNIVASVRVVKNKTGVFRRQTVQSRLEPTLFCSQKKRLQHVTATSFGISTALLQGVLGCATSIRVIRGPWQRSQAFGLDRPSGCFGLTILRLSMHFHEEILVS